MIRDPIAATLVAPTNARRAPTPVPCSHFRAAPLPEPPRCNHVSRIGRPPTDRLGLLLEQWLSELRGGYTIAGD